MRILHVVSRSPFESHCLNRCMSRLGGGDGILLSEDGVYAAVFPSHYLDPIRAFLPAIPIYVLIPDLEARGISLAELPEGVSPVDYDGFVDLTVGYPLIQSWY